MYTQKSKDCYFYFYSSCTKGDQCSFRHSKQALGTENVCSLWKEGRCFRDFCKFQHKESGINRTTIQCYWENQRGGCRKPHCAFLHSKRRNDTSLPAPVKDMICQKLDKQKSPKSLDFKIKTLEEIRKERESKQGIRSSYNGPNPSLKENKPVNDRGAPEFSKELKITKRSKELYVQKRQMKGLEQNRCSKFLKVDSEVVPNAVDSTFSHNGSSQAKEKQAVKSLVVKNSPQHFDKFPATVMPPSLSSEVRENDNSILPPELCKPTVECCELTPVNGSVLPVQSDDDPMNNGSLSLELNESTPEQVNTKSNFNVFPTTVMSPSHSSEDIEIDNSILPPELCKPTVECCELTPMNSSVFSPAVKTFDTSPVQSDNDPMNDDSLSLELNKTTPVIVYVCNVLSKTSDTESIDLDNEKKENGTDRLKDRSVFVDELDQFINEADINGGALEEFADGDDIMLKVDQFLTS